jgi:hypothetical protein
VAASSEIAEADVGSDASCAIVVQFSNCHPERSEGPVYLKSDYIGPSLRFRMTNLCNQFSSLTRDAPGTHLV